MEHDPANRSRKIFLWSCIFSLCILALLFIFFYATTRCGQTLLAGSASAGCVVGIDIIWFEGGLLAVALFSLYRVSSLMKSG